jgi:hypothetical protein
VELLKFNNYRLLGKFGMMYTNNKLSFGASLTTPSIGIFSDGKGVTRKLKESNIVDPETGEPLPNFVIVDFQEKKAVQPNAKQPFSIAVGLNYTFSERTGTVYSTLEYFNGLDPYRMVEADENPALAAGSVFEDFEFSEWLTFVSGATPVLNAGIGYRSQLKEDLMLLMGFRTDFNYRKDFDYSPYASNKIIKGLDVDLYHLSGGLTLNIRGQDLMAGIQYSTGRRRNQQQIINLTEPVEYNTNEKAALQGDRTNTMNLMVNSLSIYFGATFNFGTGGGD